MILNRIKLERTVIFIKYIAVVVPLVFPPKILIWNTMVLPAVDFLKVLELVENGLEKTSSERINNIFFTYDLSRLNVNALEANN